MAYLGHPLAGDWLYGTEDKTLIARPALHSYHLRMRHPVTGAVIDVTAPLPEDIVTRAWRDAKRGKDVSKYGFIARVQAGLAKILPHSLVMSVWMAQQDLD